jgi:hypothetical protein
VNDSKPSETRELSYSRLTSHMVCPMLEHYKYRVNGVGLKTTAPYVPFIEGEIGHYALKMFYKTGLMLRENMLKRIAKIIADAGPLDPELDDDLKTTTAAMMGITQAYKMRYYNEVDHYSGDKLTQKGKWKALMIEEPFEFPFGDFMFRGCIDLLVQNREDLKVYLVEHKFTSGQLAGRLVQLPMDLQEMIYCEAVKQKTKKYPDFKVWNFIKKSQLRRKKIGDGAYEQTGAFEARVQAQYMAEPDKMFMRSNPILVEPKMIESVKAELLKVLKDFENPDPTMRFSSCLGLYGRPCDFIQACTAKLLGHADGWNAPECQGLYKMKECQHEELDKEDDDGKVKGKAVGK